MTDLVHLLAEIVDNATRFSPPQAKVEVRAGLVGRGVVVEVEDRGLGIDPETLVQLNQTLEVPPDFDVLSLSDDARLGIFVVARLANRHSIRVTLVDSPYGGIRAVVLLPMTLVAEDAQDAGDAAMPGPPDAGARYRPARVADRPSPVVVTPAEGRRQETAAMSEEPDPRPHVVPTPDHVPGDQPLVEVGLPGAMSAGAAASDPRLTRPPLPQRERNAQLPPGLEEAPAVGDDQFGFDLEPAISPHEARHRWAAFQRGTAMGRGASIEMEQG